MEEIKTRIIDLSEKRIKKILDDITDKIQILYESEGGDYHNIITGLKEEGWIITRNLTIFQNRSNYKGWIVFCQPLQLKEKTNHMMWACKKGDYSKRVYPSKRI